MKKFIYPLLLLALPVLTFAQSEYRDRPINSLEALLDAAGSLINALIPLVIGAAVLVFLFGILKFITAGSDTEKRKEARGYMIWGIVGLFVMVSVWGLVNVLRNTFGFGNGSGANNTPSAPTIPGF